jgi:sugar phosphate permease
MSEKSSLLGRKLPFDAEKLANYRNVVYYLTFLAYAMSHFSRKSYTNVKVQMKGQAGMDPILLSQMDTAFMFFYAIGSYFSGRLGDMFHAPTIIGYGLIGSACCVFLLVFGISEDFTRSNSVAFASIYFLSIWTIHGLFQSTGGPVSTKLHPNLSQSHLYH